MKRVESVEAARLSASVAAFLVERAAELSPYSVIHLRASLEPMARGLGDVGAGDVTYADLRGYVDGLNLRYKPGTVKPTVGDIRQFWRWAKRRGVIERNPAKRLKAPSSRTVAESAAPKAAPEPDVRRVLDYLAGLLSRVVWRDVFGHVAHAPASQWTYSEQQAVRDLFVLLFLYETGARAGELRTLGSRAIDTALAVPGPVWRVAVTGKTGQSVVRFTTATAEVWLVWQAARPAGAREYAVVSFFDRCDATPIADRTTISRIIARRCQQAGVTVFRAHALRHAKVERGVAAVGMEVTSRLLGHSSTQVTAGYYGPRENQLSEAAAKTGLGYRLWT